MCWREVSHMIQDHCGMQGNINGVLQWGPEIGIHLKHSQQRRKFVAKEVMSMHRKLLREYLNQTQGRILAKLTQEDSCSSLFLHKYLEDNCGWGSWSDSQGDQISKVEDPSSTNFLNLFFAITFMYISLLGCTINFCILKCYEKYFKQISCEDVGYTQLNAFKISYIFNQLLCMSFNLRVFQKYILGQRGIHVNSVLAALHLFKVLFLIF